MKQSEDYYRGFTFKGFFAPGAMLQVYSGSRLIKQWPFGLTEEAVKAWIDKHIEENPAT